MGWYEETLRLSVVLVGTSVVLILPGVYGFGGSVALVGLLVGLGVGLLVVRRRLRTGLDRVGHRWGYYAEVLWLSPFVGGAIVGLFLTATPGELQALGGVAGLVGMGNYFFRPIYRIGYGLYAAVAKAAS